tara:strand:+ start:407 stop:1618 length:1212 start_codon:yes stop_codon:yes gene_type:complete
MHKLLLTPWYLLLLGLPCLTYGQAKLGGQDLKSEQAEKHQLIDREPSQFSLSGRLGLTQFFGELNSQDMKGFGGIALEYQATKKIAFNLGYNVGKVGGEKIDFFNSYFSTTYNSLELLAKWNLTEQFSKYKKSNFNFNLYGGVGVMNFNAKAYDITTNDLVRFSNSAASKRNQVFLKWGNPHGVSGIKNTRERSWPVGAEIGYKLSERWKLGLEYRFYFVRTDKLDATSGRRFVNPEEENTYSNTPNDKFGFLAVSLTHQFTRKARDRDGDGVEDYRDRCPDVPGLVRFSGCPDTDGDGIPDNIDKCPNEVGPLKTHGCPDSDGDGIVDAKDPCPNTFGTLKGCPDRDGDGVPDDKDVCPDVKGLIRFAGCPDTDGDGISDALDLCPDKPGKYANKGCPVAPK